MAGNTPSTNNGGGDVILNSFYNTLNSGFNRNAARLQAQAQEQAKQAQANQKELNDLVKTVNTNGVQKQDINEVSTKLNEVYDTYYKANKASSREEKLQLRMDLERKINDIGNFVSLSKARGVEQLKRAEWIGDPKNTGLVAQDGLNKFKQFSDLPTSKLPQGAFDISLYAQPDTSYVDNEDTQLINSLKSNAGATTTYGKGSMQGRVLTGDKITTSSIKQEDIGTGLMYNYENNLKYKNIVDTQANQIGVTPQELLLQKAQGLAQLNKPKVTVDRYRDVIPAVAKASGSGSSSANEGDVMSINIPYNDGKANVGFDEYVPLSIPSKNFAGSQSIDLSTGKPTGEALPSSSNYQIVGVGNAPVIKGVKGNKLQGAISQPNFARQYPDRVTYKPIIHVKLDEDGASNDYFIPYDRLPVNIKNSKSIASALKKFKPATTSNTAPSNKTSTTPKTKTSTKKTISGF